MTDSTRWILCLAIAACGAAHMAVGCGALLGIEEGTLDPSLGGQGATSTSTGDGGANVGGSASGGGIGGRGGAPPSSCDVGSDCGSDNECGSWSCDAGRCALSAEPAGTVVTGQQTDADCKQNVCDGSGGIVSENDDDDLPIDNNDCTGDVCNGGSAANPNLPAMTQCGATMALKCDGIGNCAGCSTAEDCGVSTFCVTHLCDQNRVCSIQNAMTGTTCGTCKVCQNGICQNAAGGSDPNNDCDNGGRNEVCNAAGECQCGDGLANYGEVNPDCGGPCPKCPNGSPCGGPNTCSSAFCVDGVCCDAACGGKCERCNGAVPGACAAVPANTDPANECALADNCNGSKQCFCLDGVKNNGEANIDCGGVCPMCMASCNNGIQDGTETDIDCGGQCQNCGAGKACIMDGDCVTNVCFMLACCQPDPCGPVCGPQTNNCGQPADCPCPNGFQCISGSCLQCVVSCGCGNVLDSCGMPFACPNCCGLSLFCDANDDCCAGLTCVANECVPVGAVSSGITGSTAATSGVGGSPVGSATGVGGN